MFVQSKRKDTKLEEKENYIQSERRGMLQIKSHKLFSKNERKEEKNTKKPF
jgi:hypothetical protein